MRGAAVVLFSVGAGVAIGVNIEQTIGSKVLLARAYELSENVKEILDERVIPSVSAAISKAYESLQLGTKSAPPDSGNLPNSGSSATESDAIQRLGNKLAITENGGSRCSFSSLVLYGLTAGALSGIVVKVYGTEKVSKAYNKAVSTVSVQVKRAGSAVVHVYHCTPAPAYVDAFTVAMRPYVAPFANASGQLKTQLAQDLAPVLATSGKCCAAIGTAAASVSTNPAVIAACTKTREAADKVLMEVVVMGEGIPLLAQKTGASLVAGLRRSISGREQTQSAREGETGTQPPSASEQPQPPSSSTSAAEAPSEEEGAAGLTAQEQTPIEPNGGSWIRSEDAVPEPSNLSASVTTDNDEFTIVEEPPKSTSR